MLLVRNEFKSGSQNLSAGKLSEKGVEVSISMTKIKKEKHNANM